MEVTVKSWEEAKELTNAIGDFLSDKTAEGTPAWGAEDVDEALCLLFHSAQTLFAARSKSAK